MKKIILLALLLLTPLVFSISSTDALKFIEEENNFLAERETLEKPINPIEHRAERYWVFPVVFGEETRGYLTVLYNEKKLLENDVINRELIRTTHFLRELINERKRFSESPANEWIVTTIQASTLKTLSNTAKNKAFELNIVEADIGTPQASTQINIIKNKLSFLEKKIDEAAQAIEYAAEKEALFLHTPNTSGPDEIRKEFETVFESVNSVEIALQDYLISVNVLKDLISRSGHQNAPMLLRQVDVPSDFFSAINSMAKNARTMKANLDSVYSRISQTVDHFLDFGKKRIKRNTTHSILYETDPAIQTQTGNPFSIKKLMEEITKTEHTPYWKNREALAEAQNSWERAERQFREENYELAQRTALDARRNALMVVEEGYTESKPIDNTIFIYIAIALVLILIAIYAYNNREKIIIKEPEKKEF
jgi:hypothetical protein